MSNDPESPDVPFKKPVRPGTERPYKPPNIGTNNRRLTKALRGATGNSNKLSHNVGPLLLSDPGYRQLIVSRKIYGGESVSYTVDRILQRMHLVRVPIVLTVDMPTWDAMCKDAVQRGYDDPEIMLEEALMKQYGGRV